MASRLYSGKIWKGMNAEMVRDSWGRAGKINRVISGNDDDVIPGRGRESDLKGRVCSEVLLVLNQSDGRMVLDDGRDDGGAVIGRGVVDDDDLVG